MTKNLIPMTKETALMVASDTDNLDGLLKQIRRQALSHQPDLRTAKSRKEILSLAYKVSRSKTLLDDTLKDMATEWRRKINLIDKSRKSARDFLDALRDEIKQPVIEWQQAEEEKIKAEEAVKKYLSDWDEAITCHERFLLKKQLEQKQEKLRVEQEKLRVEREKIEEEKRKEYKKKMRKEREARLKQEAIEEERHKAKREEERHKQELARKEEEKNRAVEKARQDAFDKIQQEKQIEEEKRRKEHEQKIIRAKNKKHRENIDSEIVLVIGKIGIKERKAESLINLINDGLLPHVTINY